MSGHTDHLMGAALQRGRALACRLCTMAALATAPLVATADDFQWLGAGATDNWTNPFNWDSLLSDLNIAPVSDAATTVLKFGSSEAQSRKADLNADWSINGLTFYVGNFVGRHDLPFELYSSNGSTLTIGDGGISDTIASNAPEAVRLATDTISHAIHLAATQTWSANSLVVSGARSGTADLRINAQLVTCAKAGGCTPHFEGESGFVLLSGNGSAQTGNYRVYGGTLGLAGGDAVSVSSTVVLEAGATLDLLNSSEQVGGLRGAGLVRIGLGNLETGIKSSLLTAVDDDEFAGRLTGIGTFSKAGAGLMRLSGDNSGFTGTLKITGGTLEVAGATDTLSDAARVEVARGATLRLAGDGETFGSLAGDGAVVLEADTAVGSNNASTIFSGVLSGAAHFTKRGSGALSLTGDNTWSGALSIAAGVLEAGLGDNLSNDNSVDVQAGATLLVSGDDEKFGALSGAGTVNLKRAITVGLRGDDSTFSGRITGSGDVDKNGAGTLLLSGRNDFRGAIHVNGGTLAIGGNDDTLSNSQSVIVNDGARLVIGGNGEDFGALGGEGEVRLDANLGVGADQGNARFAGGLRGNGRFTKLGRGVMSLAGHSTLGGNVVVDDGTLALVSGADFALAGTLSMGVHGVVELAGGDLSAATINAGRGQLRFKAGALHVDTFIGSLVNLGGTLAPGHSPGTTTIVGDYTQGAAATLDIELGSADLFDVLLVQNGKASLDGRLAVHLLDGYDPGVGAVFAFLSADFGIDGSFALFDAPTWNGKRFVLERLDAQHLGLRVAAVPLPAGSALFASGMAILMVSARRRVRAVHADARGSASAR